MTVSLITRVSWYVGLSTDTKPTSALIGSYFFELDTPSVWRWDGSDWYEQS